MTKVTSADLQKHFGIYKREALSRPVEVTVHGKPTLMLMSYDFYQSLVEKKEIAAAEGADGDLGGPPPGRPGGFGRA